MGIKLGRNILDLVRVVSPSDLIVKPRLEKFILEHGDKPFSPEVADWVRNQLTAAPRMRVKSFAGSASGSCHRAQIFQYLGIPQPGVIDEQLQQIYNDGHWRHLRLQAQIAEAGIIPLEGLEYPLSWPAMRSMGTADGNGIVPDDHPNPAWRGKLYGLELKGAHEYVARWMNEPSKYMQQLYRYFLSGGFDLFVVLVENKNTQELKEWVIEPDPELLDQQLDELTTLNRHVDDQTLPERLPACQQRTGTAWKNCPFGGNKNRPCVQLPVGKAKELFGK